MEREEWIKSIEEYFLKLDPKNGFTQEESDEATEDFLTLLDTMENEKNES